MTKQQKDIIGVWNFFQKLKHNCSQKKAEQFLGKKIHSSDFPTENILLQKSTLSQKKWSLVYKKKAEKYVPALRFFPGICGAAVCNSVALGTGGETSDIDLLIITAPKRLWTARIFSTIYFQILGIRRHENKINGRFCLSFFVTEEALDFKNIALHPKDPYLAFWISSLTPLFGRQYFEKINKINKTFMQKNASIVSQLKRSEAQNEGSEKNLIKKILEIFFGDWFEILVQKLFKKRTLHKRDLLPNTSGTIISENILKFHNTDKRDNFL